MHHVQKLVHESLALGLGHRVAIEAPSFGGPPKLHLGPPVRRLPPSFTVRLQRGQNLLTIGRGKLHDQRNDLFGD